MTTTATSYNPANPHVSFTLTPLNFISITGISATVRSSNAGPSMYEIAYFDGSSWIDGGAFDANVDDCGYSHTEEFFDASAFPFFFGSDITVGIFPWNPGTPAPGAFQVNTISVMGDGTSLKPAPNAIGNVTKNDAVQLYPNPANSVLNIAAAEKVNVSVMSIDGKLLMNQNNAKQLNVSALANGLYIIKMYNQNNALIQTSKFTKQ
jgi:hypothetical protein